MFVTADELTGCPPESTAHVRVPLAARSLGNGKSDKWEITRAHRRGGIESFLCPKSPPGSVPPSRPLPRPPLARLHSFAFSRTSDSRNRSAAFAERRPSPRDVRRVHLRVLSWLDGQLRPGPARRPAVCTCRSPFIRRLLRASRQLPRIPRLNPVLAGAGARGLGARGRGLPQHSRCHVRHVPAHRPLRKALGARAMGSVAAATSHRLSSGSVQRAGPERLAGSRKCPAPLASPSPRQQPLQWGHVLTGGHGCTCRQACQGEGQKVSFEPSTWNHLGTVVSLHSSVCG